MNNLIPFPTTTRLSETSDSSDSDSNNGKASPHPTRRTTNQQQQATTSTAIGSTLLPLQVPTTDQLQEQLVEAEASLPVTQQHQEESATTTEPSHLTSVYKELGLQTSSSSDEEQEDQNNWDRLPFSVSPTRSSTPPRPAPPPLSGPHLTSRSSHQTHGGSLKGSPNKRKPTSASSIQWPKPTGSYRKTRRITAAFNPGYDGQCAPSSSSGQSTHLNQSTQGTSTPGSTGSAPSTKIVKNPLYKGEVGHRSGVIRASTSSTIAPVRPFNSGDHRGRRPETKVPPRGVEIVIPQPEDSPSRRTHSTGPKTIRLRTAVHRPVVVNALQRVSVRVSTNSGRRRISVLPSR